MIGFSEAAAMSDVGGTFCFLGRIIGDRSSELRKRNEGGPGDEAGRPGRCDTVARCCP